MLKINQQGAGETLVFIHGWGMHSGLWQPLLTELADQYELIYFDLPGYGENAHLHIHSLDDVADAMAETLTGPVHLVGWSLGGLYAQAYAMRYPQQVKSIVRMCSSPKFTADTTWHGTSVETLNQFQSQLEKNYKNTITRFLLLQLNGLDDAKQIYQAIKSDWPEQLPSQETLVSGLNLLATVDQRQELLDTSCKVLHILGKLDAIVPARISDLIREIAPDNEVITLPKASHMPFISHTQQVAQTMRNFYEKVI